MGLKKEFQVEYTTIFFIYMNLVPPRELRIDLRLTTALGKFLTKLNSFSKIETTGSGY
jgi:hypothetical protein